MFERKLDEARMTLVVRTTDNKLLDVYERVKSMYGPAWTFACCQQEQPAPNVSVTEM